MKKISIADVTIRESSEKAEFSMSFKEKMEVAKQLEKRNVDIIEMPNVAKDKTDALLVKSLAPMIKESILSVGAGISKEEVDKAWEAVSSAAKPRIRICAPTSAVQMEFICGKKPAKVLEAVKEVVAYAKSKCADIEFSAQDATRSEMPFLCQVIEAAIENGATTIDICDTAGIMFPEEFKNFIEEIKANVPAMENVVISATCSDELNVANANVFAGAKAGVSQIKASLIGNATPSLETVVHTITMKGDAMGVECGVSQGELARAVRQMTWLDSNKKTGKTPFGETTGNDAHEDVNLTAQADIAAVIKAVKKLGYELSDDDNAKVFKEFKRVSAKKPVGAKELEAIIATAALQVPPTYQLVDYVINSGNIITPTAQVTLDKKGTLMKGLSSGDGPIEAALLAIEMIVGHHYDLEDFQIQSVTEGSEAVGSAFVKIRVGNKVYSGNGISTDIIGASIRAYVNALNKIVHEEQNANQ